MEEASTGVDICLRQLKCVANLVVLDTWSSLQSKQ